MIYAICPLSVVPVRSNSVEKSEQVTQLLFGEIVEIMEQKGRVWSKVRCIWDNYIGWVNTQQLKPITSSEYKQFKKNFAYCLDLMQPLMSNDHHLPITIGACLPDFDGMKFRLEDHIYTFSGQAVFPSDIETTVELLLKIARKYLYAPFQWGGRSPLGIDAAGFTQMVFKIIGVSLHREAGQQVHQGSSIDFIEQALPGDLAFFENRKNTITHVGIIMPEEKIIHANGMVKIDKIDHFGIFNEQEGRYTHKLRVIKRMMKPAPIKKETKKEAIELSKKQVGLFE